MEDNNQAPVQEVDIIDSGDTFDDELPLTPLEITEDEKKDEDEEKSELNELRALAKSPAWMRLRERIAEDIASIRRLDNVDMRQANAIVGEQAKVETKVANELTMYMEYVDAAIEGGEIDEYVKWREAQDG